MTAGDSILFLTLSKNQALISETLKSEENIHLKMIEMVMTVMAICKIIIEKSVFSPYVNNKKITVWKLGNVLEKIICYSHYTIIVIASCS